MIGNIWIWVIALIIGDIIFMKRVIQVTDDWIFRDPYMTSKQRMEIFKDQTNERFWTG